MKSRSTRQKELLKNTAQQFKRFFSAEDLLEQAQRKEPNLGIATVYRFLKEQVAQGKLYTYQCDGKSIYSVEKRSHCHFICENTGKVIHFDIDNLDFLKSTKKGKKTLPGEITSFQLEIRGICNDCK
ncbi:transcriptional repressor [Candidatus Woesearchaeota archaeon]|nr:MAG: transcriptional repressor [Candidatus Woesearchaeota archaeon]